MRHDPSGTPADGPALLLMMAEALIAAHKVAKVDDDGYTLDLLEDVMRHVGRRLIRETGLEHSFDRRKMGSA